MKVGISVDDIKVTRYTLGKYDFYTRLIDFDPTLARKLQEIEELNVLGQRILAAMYNSNGKFILPDDLKRIECVRIESVDPTQEVESEKPRKRRASEAPLSNESQKT